MAPYPPALYLAQTFHSQAGSRDEKRDLPDGQISWLSRRCARARAALHPRNPLRAKTKFAGLIKVIWVVQTGAQNFPLFTGFEDVVLSRHPASARGAYALSSRNVRRDAVDASGAFDDGAGLRTAKSCGPDAPTLASSS
jgi:hypothetical protein